MKEYKVEETALWVVIYPANAERCSVLAVEAGSEEPSAERIFAEGETARTETSSVVKLPDLQGGVRYLISAVAEAGGVTSEIVRIEMTTSDPKPEYDYLLTGTSCYADYFEGWGWDYSTNYVLALKGSAEDGSIYTLQIDFYAKTSDPTQIPAKEYVIDTNGTEMYDGLISYTYASEALSGFLDANEQQISRFQSGSLTVEYADGTYTLSGKIVLENDEIVKYSYEGPISIVSGF